MSCPANILVLAAQDRQAGILQQLDSLGYEVQAATDCLAAMGLVKAGGLDLAVVADGSCQLGAADTARVLKSLRTDRYLAVVVLAAGNLSAEQRQHLQESGVDEVVPAGADVALLHAHIQSALRFKSMCDQLRQVQGELAKTLARENALLKQLREDNRDLKVRSITDGLTAIYNYRYLMEWLKTEFKISRRYGHDLSMVIIDVDFFKRVNDEYGHPFGDYALKEVAVILKQCARESDLVARYAGDEFAVVCPRTGHKEVQAMARRILVACRKHPFVHHDKPVPITLSVGTATYPEDPEIVSPELLVFLADQALYQTKRQGRNGVTSWHEIDPETRAAIRRELRGPDNPLLADDPKSRLEIAAAARLVGATADPISPRLPHRDAWCAPAPTDSPSEP